MPELIVFIILLIGLLLLALFLRNRRIKKIVAGSPDDILDAENRKKAAISALFLDSQPVIRFTIPSVICVLPPRTSRGNNRELAGNLYFTDKGVAFIQLVGFWLPDKVQRNTAMTFGALGGVAVAMDTASQRKKALTQVKAVSDNYREFKQLVENAKDILFIPKNTISKIRYKQSLEFEINTAGKWPQFLLENSKKTYEQYQSQIESYLVD